MKKKSFFESEERDHRSDILDIIRSGKDDEEVGLLLEDYHDNDIASVLDELTAEEKDRLLRVLGNEGMSDIVTFLEDASDYLSTLDADRAADIIEQMDADEALEALEDLDDEVKREVLGLIEDDIKEDIELLNSYCDDEFGGMMSTNYISVRRDITIKQAMRTLIAEAAENDNIHTIFVSDVDGSFYGSIDLKELIIARSDTPLEDLIYTNFPFVYDTDSISENIERLRGYSEDLIPVLSSRDNSLLGVITSMDIVEIVDKELGDDYAKLAALSAEEEKDESLLASMKKRVPWLIILLFLGLGVSAVVGLFEGVVAELPMIVAFQSLILGMAGNVGTQSLAVTVRVLGSEDDLGFKKQMLIIGKETRVALLNGLALGIFSFTIVGAYLLLIGGNDAYISFTTAGCVGAALLFAMTISGFTGAAIPMCFYRLGIDPAVASGPLITTVNDLVAVVSYYGLAWALLLNFGR
ncbi:MAG: magnesium transporter [Clostridia bacterium]|nr:magnesium transporter [Clostridia bacterium]